MPAPLVEISEKRPLSILGIGEAEEDVYRWLLVNPDSSTQELTEALSLLPHKARSLLNALEAKGLIVHTPERPRRYNPISPDIVMESLALRREEILKQARGTIHELQEQVSIRHHGALKPMVELIKNPEVERQIFEHMRRATQHEIVALVRPPMRVSQLALEPEPKQSSRTTEHTANILVRDIMDPRFLALPGALDAARKDVTAGDKVRVLSRLPFKMVLSDRRVALIPLNLQQQQGPSLLVRSSALLDALYVLFDMLWERAAPISFTRLDEMPFADSDAQLSKGAEELIRLMAAGLNDKSIIQELEISPRTLNRRLRTIERSYGAHTRFQLGWLAAQRLFNTDATPSIPENRE